MMGRTPQETMYIERRRLQVAELYLQEWPQGAAS